MTSPRRNSPLVAMLIFTTALASGCAGSYPRGDHGPSLEKTPWARPDSRLPDGQMLKDLHVSDAINSACGSSFSVTFVYGETMVICRNTNSSPAYDQCNAEKACNTSQGWELCPAQQFIARGGDKTPAPHTAWMKGCLRDEMTVLKPEDRVCDCQDNTTAYYNEGYDCTSKAPVQSNLQNLGVVTSATCMMLGYELEQAQAGYWYFSPATATLTAAVCCK